MLNDTGGPGQWLADTTGHFPNPCSQGSVSLPEFPDLDILSLEVTAHHDYTFTPPSADFGESQDPITGLDFCNITVAYTHPAGTTKSSSRHISLRRMSGTDVSWLTAEVGSFPVASAWSSLP